MTIVIVMENFIKPRAIFSVLIIAIVSVILNSTFRSDKTEPEDNREANLQSEVMENIPNRIPASSQLIKAEIYKPGIARSAVKKTNFQDDSAPDIFDHTPEQNAANYQSVFTESPNIQVVASEPTNEPQSATPPKQKEKEKETQIFLGSLRPALVIKESKTPKTVTPSASAAFTNTSAPLPAVIQNTCSASIAGGSFNHPIGVTLSCSFVSDIKYCLAIDTGNGCCDPHTVGITYNSKIGIGAKNENYCLSFFGDSPFLGLSDLYQQSYTFNSLLPDLQIGHQQNYYQTTQLAGKTYLSSLDFGKNGYGAGIINLKNHDPGVGAENLNCSEIAQDYSALIAPSPLEILSLLDVSLENPATQLEIPLRLDQLDYGLNYITGYMLNNNYDLPLYSCSTSMVVLSDFEFFEQQLTFGEPGDNSTREFTGGLTSFGFFEPEATINRGPAGSSSEEKNGQQLQNGMLGIFY